MRGRVHAAPVDGRVIATANVELDLALNRGQFQEDYHSNARELVNALERARVFFPLGGKLPMDVG